MIVAKCPLRVSLAGGGTDLEKYIEHHDFGHVVNFSCNLYTYVSIHENNRDEYIVNYSLPEKVKRWQDIKNNLAREAFRRFDRGPITITFNSDIYSSGSGLGSSSSFCIALIKAFNDFYNLGMSDFEICKTSIDIERTFNPLTGRQDAYGCGLGGLKYLKFLSDCENPEVTYLSKDVFKKVKMWLVPTKIERVSTDPLTKTIDSDLSKFFDCASELKNRLISNSYSKTVETITKGWSIKKQETPHIIDSEELKNIDDDFSENPYILSHRLCGAGGGGYFFCMTPTVISIKDGIEIEIDDYGVKSYKI